MRSTILLSLVLLAVGTSAQTENVKRRSTQGDMNGVVTQAECEVAIQRTEAVLSKVTGTTLAAPKIAIAEAPARRTAIIARLDRMFDLLKGKFIFTPKKVKFDAKSLALPAGHPQRAALERLVKWGCLSKTSPLATSKLETVRIGDFGEALGIFMLRITDLTHKPDPKYSPYIGGGDSG